MTKKPTKPRIRNPSKKPPTLHQNPTVSDDEETLDFDDIPNAQRLNNAYAEYLDLENTKSERQLAREHGCGKSSL
jgi:hypothetical protein